MPGLEVAFRQKWTSRRGISQRRDPLERFPVRDARVVQTTRAQHRWVLFAAHVVNWTVRAHVVVKCRLVWISPLLPLGNSQRDGAVTHRRHDVHEWHTCDGAIEHTWIQVQCRTHGKPACAAALDAEPVGRTDS
eukprot:CAMPEP_0198718404 /NCGR_PEP_ID=MMETSP1471-20131121/50490_2 /TAXON_ID=41880 /ORGANISM="Pycnococcus provasolii, Strain RCC733" /LENGTH=133 /DNA_ID=CAMNT_0044479079 /DNA_START=6 /DNA_END=404 /DNA_ORIENTATION=-